jgi:hypothetical protein
VSALARSIRKTRITCSTNCWDRQPRSTRSL